MIHPYVLYGRLRISRISGFLGRAPMRRQAKVRRALRPDPRLREPREANTDQLRNIAGDSYVVPFWL